MTDTTDDLEKRVAVEIMGERSVYRWPPLTIDRTVAIIEKMKEQEWYCRVTCHVVSEPYWECEVGKGAICLIREDKSFPIAVARAALAALEAGK